MCLIVCFNNWGGAARAQSRRAQHAHSTRRAAGGGGGAHLWQERVEAEHELLVAAEEVLHAHDDARGVDSSEWLRRGARVSRESTRRKGGARWRATHASSREQKTSGMRASVPGVQNASCCNRQPLHRQVGRAPRMRLRRARKQESWLSHIGAHPPTPARPPHRTSAP